MDSKRLFAEITLSRRKFNSLHKMITQSLNEGKPLGLLNGMFDELKIVRRLLTERHENYPLHLLMEDSSGNVDTSDAGDEQVGGVSDTDTYLDVPDNQFRDVESQLYNLDKIEQEEKLRVASMSSKALELALYAAEETRNIQSLRNIRAAEHASLEIELKKVSSLNNETSETSLISTRTEIKRKFDNVKCTNDKISYNLNEVDSVKEID